MEFKSDVNLRTTKKIINDIEVEEERSLLKDGASLTSKTASNKGNKEVQYEDWLWHRMFKKQSKRKLVSQLRNSHELHQCLSFFDLMCYGLGANIGSNFFLFIGQLILIAGPSIVFSFLIGGIISLITAFCFAELSSRIPTNGGQYSYVYIYYGELLGWISFCLMSFEYGLSSALNAVGFMETLNYALKQMGIHYLPDYIFQLKLFDIFSLNPMACLLILLLTMLLLKGIQDSILVNNIFTMCILAFFMYCNIISYGIYKPELMTPFFAGGIQGVMRGAALCFFGYTSFEQPITVAEEAIKPQRDLPKSLISQIVIETIQYAFLAFLVSGFVSAGNVSETAMMPKALMDLGYTNQAYVILIGTLIGMLPTVLDSLLSQTRILYRVSKDQLISSKFQKVDPDTQAPYYSIKATGILIMVIVLFFDITFLAQFISLATLISYCTVMSIVIFKKAARKKMTIILQLILFFVSLMFGILSYQQYSFHVIILTLSAVVTSLILIVIESKLYPDLVSIEEDKVEDKNFIDKPYSCMLNPLVPALGISFSGITIGYIDQSVWITFFIIIVAIVAGYFIFVIPRKIRLKLKKQNSSHVISVKLKRKNSDEFQFDARRYSVNGDENL